MKRLRIAIAGCGQVGQQLLQLQYRAHFTATLRSSPEQNARKARLRALGARPVLIDLHAPLDTQRLAAFGGRIIWMAPPPASQPPSKALKRVALHLSAHAIRYNKTTPSITYISTTGVYGNAEGRWIDELTPRKAESDRAKRRIAEEDMLFEAAKGGQIKVQVLRAPGIYGEDRLPIERLRNRQPALHPEEDSWSNHIHETDLARLAYRAQLQGHSRMVVNACDSQPLQMGDYFDLVADALNLPRPPRVDRQTAQRLVSPMMWSFMRESRKIRSIRIGALHCPLRYPTVKAYLAKRQLDNPV